MPMEGRRCYRCARFPTPFAFQKARASFYDVGLVRTLLRTAKYGGIPGILDRFIPYVQMDWAVDVGAVIPIPPSPVRYRERGFAPTHRFAQAVSQILDIPMWDLLGIQGGRPQAELHQYEARIQNARGRLTLKKKPPTDGGYGLLVDDVITTGATLHEAAKLLRQIGIETVAWCLASEVPPFLLPKGLRESATRPDGLR